MNTPESQKLVRGLSLFQATAVNMLDMVGIGPFVVISSVVAAMNGPQCILAWVFGAVLALMDGTVWAELGAAMPEAGGSYVFLNRLYGEKKWGSFFSFLFIWQTVIQAPLVIASGSIGFAAYLKYLVPLDYYQSKMVSGGLVILLSIILYRRITSIGKISVFLWVIVIGTILWIIFGGLTHFDTKLAFSYPEHAIEWSPVFFAGLGLASVKTIYSYLGYYNVCHLGAEIKNPEKNIPRSIFISITGIAVLYLLMQLSVLAVVPWQKIKAMAEQNQSDFVVSVFMETLYGKTAASIATVFILCIAASSLFAVILGYSRIPYAAAKDGNFFSIFSRTHPTKNFPHVSQLILCAIAFVFSLLFKLKEVIGAIIFMRILVQFVGQAIGLILLRARHKEQNRPFRMPLFPLPALLSIAGWMFIFLMPLLVPVPGSNDRWFILGAVALIVVGIILFLIRASMRKDWPFEEKIPDTN
jgi:fructoselysine transporter